MTPENLVPETPPTPVYDPANFDMTSYDVSSYCIENKKPWGWEKHLVPEGTPYMLKLIGIDAGKRLSLQVHDEKQESWTLMSGRAAVIWQNDKGEMITTELVMGQGYSTKLGQPHRLMGITDCIVIEASTPESGTTFRLEDDFNRPDETPEQRKIERSQ